MLQKHLNPDSRIYHVFETAWHLILVNLLTLLTCIPVITAGASLSAMYDVLLRYFTLLDKYKMRYAPKTPDEETDRRFVYALQNIGYAEYILEAFNHYDKEQQKKIKPEVDRIEREYKRSIEEWGEW